MAISFVAAMDFQHPSDAPAPETFALVGADQTAFPRLFPFSLADLKTGLAGNLPGYNLADNAIKCAVQAVIQAGLVGGGSSVAAAEARASVIIRQTCAIQLALAILVDAGA
jgi:hypothetical protein